MSLGLITAGLAIKSGLFPFHLWMPDTYGQATPASSGILSGVVSKGYIVFLIKVIYQSSALTCSPPPASRRCCCYSASAA